MYIYIYISAAPARHGAWRCCMHHVTRHERDVSHICINGPCHTWVSMSHVTGSHGRLPGTRS